MQCDLWEVHYEYHLGLRCLELNLSPMYDHVIKQNPNEPRLSPPSLCTCAAGLCSTVSRTSTCTCIRVQRSRVAATTSWQRDYGFGLAQKKHSSSPQKGLEGLAPTRCCSGGCPHASSQVWME